MNQSFLFLTQPTQDSIEPGMLPVFRTVIGLELILVVPPTLSRILGGQEEEGWALGIYSILWLVLVLVYLLWPKLPQRLGWLYLPLALITVTLCTVVEHAWLVSSFTQRPPPPGFDMPIGGIGWLLLIRLLLPLVLTAWQYNWLGVLLFAVGVTLLNGLLTYWLVTERFFFLVMRQSGPHMVIYLLVGVIITRMMTAQRKQREALATANTQLAQHAATLEQLTLSRERNRLARELHDTLAHTLSAVSIQLEAVDSAWASHPDTARLLLGKSLAQTRSGLTETRRALQALRASPLEDLGLALALRNLAESTAKRGSLRVQMQIDEELDPLPPDLEQNLYRVAQEALANALKHAGATELKVGLAVEPGQTVLTISDNGAGFDPTTFTANEHYGLRGMQERAEVSGGTLTVQSQPGAGTTVQMTVRR